MIESALHKCKPLSTPSYSSYVPDAAERPAPATAMTRFEALSVAMNEGMSVDGSCSGPDDESESEAIQDERREESPVAQTVDDLSKRRRQR